MMGRNAHPAELLFGNWIGLRVLTGVKLANGGINPTLRSLKEEQISFELVKQIDKILKDSINKHVEINEAHEISLRKIV